MQAQHGKVKVVLQLCRRAPDLAVSLCVPYTVCAHCLRQLEAGAPVDPAHLCAGAEGAALAYAVFEMARGKLMGNPLESFRTRVSRVSCSGQHGHFMIKWGTAGTFSGFRKTAGIVAKALVPARVYSKYAINIKNLGGKQNRAFFNHAVRAFIDAIKAGVTLVAAGKINMTDEKLGAIAEAVAGKIPEQVKPEGEHAAAPSAGRAPLPALPSIRVPYGVASIAVADYVTSKLGVDAEICDGAVVIHMGSIVSKIDMLQRGVDDYVARYTRLKDDLTPVLTYLAIVKYNADCALVDKLMRAKPTAKALQDMIHEALDKAQK